MFNYYLAKVLKKFRGSAIRNCTIHPSSKIESGGHIIYSKFDRHSFCGYNCEILYCDIGAFTSIANNVIIGGGIHPMNWVAMSPVFYEGRDSVKAKYSEHKRPGISKTIIGHDVWIGESAIIKQGVSIGHGAVIGMGSIVTKDVSPYDIVAGNPARVIRKRFSNDIVEDLLKSKWWNFDDKKLKYYAQYFTNPEEFLRALKK